MLSVIDYQKLEEYTKEGNEQQFSKRTLDAIHFILLMEKSFSLSPDNKILEHQNTTYENYQYILKDLINDVNDVVDLTIRSLEEIFTSANTILKDTPLFLEHSLYYDVDSETICSYTIKENYCNYLNKVNELGLIASKFIKYSNEKLYDRFCQIMQFKSGYDCMLDENKQLIKYSFDNLFKYSNRQEKHSLILTDYGADINNLLTKYKNTIDDETMQALKFFSYSDKSTKKWHSNSTLYSINLADEKIIPKYSKIYTYSYNDYEFDVLSIDSVKATSTSISTSYGFKCSFDISYYMKKALIQKYTKKDMFSFMCIYKDFLSMYEYNNFRDKSDFSQTHPMIKEANLLNSIYLVSNKYKNRLLQYKEILKDSKEQSPSVLILIKPIKEWCDLLSFPDATRKHFYYKFNSNKEPTDEEFEKELDNYANETKQKEISKLLDSNEKVLMYEDIKRCKTYLDDVLKNILAQVYEESSSSDITDLDISRFFTKRDTATFHTTLKNGIVFDYRDKQNIYITKDAAKRFTKEHFGKINELLEIHRYHDFLEIDVDMFSKDSKITIDELIVLLEMSNKFNFPVSICSALKFRKLKQYKATGIYFSYSKQLGLDFRDGTGSYMHEIAHHIDLNRENPHRDKMVRYLYSYFSNKITNRADYYLKSEELIARAAEVSLILLFGRYEKFKSLYDQKVINEDTLVRAVEDTFEKTAYSKFMGSLSSYHSVEYFNYKTAILNKDFKAIDYLIVYFKSFWSGKVISLKDETRLPSNTNITYNNEKKFSKKNERSYDYFYRDIFRDRVNLSCI